MTVGIADLQVHLPAERMAVEEVLARCGGTVAQRRVFRKLYGLDRIAVLPPGGGVVDLLVAAGRGLLDRVDPAEVDLVLYGHTNVYPGPDQDPVLVRVLDALGLRGVPAYGVSQVACTSVLRCIEMAGWFLGRTTGHRSVLVLGGDHSGLDIQSRVIPGMTVTGDAAVALLVRPAAAGVRYTWLGGAGRRDTRFHRGSRMSQEDRQAFVGISVRHVRAAVDAAVDRAGLRLADVDWVLPHNSNAMLWRAWSRQTGFPLDSVYLHLLPELGHNVGTDALINLADGVRTGRIRPGQRCVLVAIGQGAYFYAAVVQVTATDAVEAGR
jgi:3-oxoacyl-[acyl-carrier-protein] synthase-3